MKGKQMKRKNAIIVGIGILLIVMAGIFLYQFDFLNRKGDDISDFTAEELARLKSEEAELHNAIAEWGLDPSDELADLRKSAQEYLVQYHDGMKIDSAEFYHHVNYLFNVMDDYTMSLEKKAKEDTEFAQFYFYASMYYNVIEAGKLDMESYQMSDEILSMNVDAAIHWIATETVRADRG